MAGAIEHPIKLLDLLRVVPTRPGASLRRVLRRTIDLTRHRVDRIATHIGDDFLDRPIRTRRNILLVGGRDFRGGKLSTMDSASDAVVSI